MDLIPPRPVSALATQLQRRGFKNRGIEHLWMEKNELTRLLQTSQTAASDDPVHMARLMEVSAAQWRKWYFTDLEGHPILAGITPRDSATNGR